MAPRPNIHQTKSNSLIPIEVSFHGVGGSFPSNNHRVGGQTTSMSMKFGDTLIGFDSGSGMLDWGNQLLEQCLAPDRTMAELDKFIKGFLNGNLSTNDLGSRIAAEYLKKDPGINIHLIHSHVHKDHLDGITSFKPIYLKDTNVHMIAGLHDGLNIHEVMQQFVFKKPVFPVQWEWLQSKRTMQIVKPGEEFTIPCSIGGDIRVKMLQMNHPNQAYGYRFEWGGTVIAVTLDHEGAFRPEDKEFDDNILELWHEADLVITEAQYLDSQYDKKKGFGHISESAAAEHAKIAKPKLIYTMHHDPDNTFKEIVMIARTIERLSGIPTFFAMQDDIIYV